MNQSDAAVQLRSIREDHVRYLSTARQELATQRIRKRIEAIDLALEALQIMSLVRAADADA